MAYLNSDIQKFAKKVGFVKTSLGWKDKSGFLISEKEIIDFYNEIKKIKEDKFND